MGCASCKTKASTSYQPKGLKPGATPDNPKGNVTAGASASSKPQARGREIIIENIDVDKEKSNSKHCEQKRFDTLPDGNDDGSNSRLGAHAVGPGHTQASFDGDGGLQLHLHINPKLAKKHKIYQISTTFPVETPYSNPSDWQRVLPKPNPNPQGNQPTQSEEDLVMRLLSLRNRNWIQEQIAFQTEFANKSNNSLATLVINRRHIELREHFNWLVWALAQFYFYPHPKFEKGNSAFNLPKINSKKWTEGFEWNGLFVRVLPYEDSYYIRNEMQALKYVQTELMELDAVADHIQSQFNQNSPQKQKEKTEYADLHKDVILPLLSLCTCAGFLLYASPVIYTQELEKVKEHYARDQTVNHGRPKGNNGFHILQNSSMVAHAKPKLQNHSMVVASHANLGQSMDQSNMSFSYLHNNIPPEAVGESLFKFMPTLKNLTTDNLLQVIDFEEFNNARDQSSAYQSIEIKYLLVNLYSSLQKLSETGTSTVMLRVPINIHEEISFQQFPKNGMIETRDLMSSLGGQTNDSKQPVDAKQFQTRFMSKHGWDLLLISRNVKEADTNEQPSLLDNKRAIHLYAQKEEPSKVSQARVETPIKVNEDEKNNNSRYLSPQKQTILKRAEENVEKIQGPVMMTAHHFKKSFKLQYSLVNHTHSTNVETMYSAAVEHVSRIIEYSDTVYNADTLKELLHRKGLNLRFLWILLLKLKKNFGRELVQIAILLRVMRRVVNEEVKIKGRVAMVEAGVLDEYFLGNQTDVYKDIQVFYINTLLKRKFVKHKPVFDESLFGLFLSRASILALSHNLQLSKEELLYLESKDILEDILDAPSKNPALFLNQCQMYFGTMFKYEFMRGVRNDKHVLLHQAQPVTVNDYQPKISITSKCAFSIREQAYYILASQITHHQQVSQKNSGKIKTKSEKDKLKNSFSRPARGAVDKSFSQMSEKGDSETVRGKQSMRDHYKDSQPTIRQYTNMDREIQFDDYVAPSPNQVRAASRKHDQHDSIIDLSRVSKRSSFSPKKTPEIVMPSVLYKMTTFLSNHPQYFFDDQSNQAKGNTFTVLRPFYEMPSHQIIDEWIICLESMLKGVVSVTASEQVLLEAFVYQALMIYFFLNDDDSFIKVLNKCRDTLFVLGSCSPETITMTQILTGMYLETSKEHGNILETEKSYLYATICQFLMYGDPRGKGNTGVPIGLFLSWKLSVLAMCEDKKIQDSEYADELFDAFMYGLANHKQKYKSQKVAGKAVSPFFKKLQEDEDKKSCFDIKKYRSKAAQHVIHAGRSARTGTIQKVYESTGQNHHKTNLSHLEDPKDMNLPHLVPKSSTMVVGVPPMPSFGPNSNAQNMEKDIQAMQKDGSKMPIDVSEIDLDVEDEYLSFFLNSNFRAQEWQVGKPPFLHWTQYKQEISTIISEHKPVLQKGFSGRQSVSNGEQNNYLKQVYKQMLVKVEKDLLFSWLIKFNPMGAQSGMQWTNTQILEMIFNQGQQMVQSSHSSVILSNHNMSQQSLSLGNQTPTSQKERKNYHLGSYSQILSKESGGLSKSEMNGVMFTWGTDFSGQVGLDFLHQTPAGQREEAFCTQAVRTLYPRMMVSLKDELIREVTCGHSHTMAITLTGAVYAWGNNEKGQLGLGDLAPEAIKRPCPIPQLTNVHKISCGHEHSLCYNKTGELFIWGDGSQLGLGDEKQRNYPTKVDFFNHSRIQQAVCGGLHTVALTKEGQVFAWGSTEGGQLGLPMKTLQAISSKGDSNNVLKPTLVPGIEGKVVLQLACGEAHTLVLTKQAEIYGWGMSNYGQLGLGFSADSFELGYGQEKSKVYEATKLDTLKNIRVDKIICGATFSLFQTEQGELYGCGMNDMGQLGLDTFQDEMLQATLDRARNKNQSSSDVTYPTKVICFQGVNMTNIQCGENHALSVAGEEKNLLWSWGQYRHGQLGLGEVSAKSNPRPVQTLSGNYINKIACGSTHSVALIGDCQPVSSYSLSTHNDIITNYWVSDIRGLNARAEVKGSEEELEEDEVPFDENEGAIKNPK